MKLKLEVAKLNKGCQVEILSSKLAGKLSKLDRKIIAQQKKELRRKTIVLNKSKSEMVVQ